jgi:hypothetical protein
MLPKRKTRKTASTGSAVVSIAAIERRIYAVRGQKVMLDVDLAELYGVSTGNLNLDVRRNPIRFPRDFMFHVTSREAKGLLLQIARANGRGGRRTRPYAFTELGVAMLSSVLKGERSALVNVRIMRAFVHMREMLVDQKDILNKLDELEKKYETHDTDIKAVFGALKKLIQVPPPPQRKIGFLAEGPRP